MKLGDIATIKSGYNFNRKACADRVDTDAENLVKAIFPKDIAVSGRINVMRLELLPLPQAKDTYFAKPNDILFVGKGNFNVAFVMQKIKAVPSSSFYKIEITDRRFAAGYVFAFLKFHLDVLTRNSRRSTERISSLTLKELSDTDIPLISLTKQQQLKKIVECYQKELEILEKLKHNLNALTKGIFTQTIKEHING